MAIRATQVDNPVINVPTDANLAIADAKLYVPIATLSTQGNTKLL